MVGARSWPSFRLVPTESLPRARSSPASRVHVPGTLPFAVVLRSQTGLTANLQGFRIGTPEGWPLLQRRARALDLRVASMKAVPGMSYQRAVEADMPIQIRMTGPDADRELSSLYAWLREQPDIRHHARMSLIGPEPGPSDMGAAFDVIQLVVDSGFQTLNLALAYAAWRATRPGHPQVTIERDDTKITLDGAEPDTVDAIVRALT